MSKSNFRMQVWFKGRVQGVGFRYKSLEVSKEFCVTGFVENLDDGRVLLLAVGEENEVRAFVAELSKRMADFIKSSENICDKTELKYEGFKILL